MTSLLPTPKADVSSPSSAFVPTDEATDVVETTGSAELNHDKIAAFLAGDIDASVLPQPGWGPIGPEVYSRTYSRDIFSRDPETSDWIFGEDGLKVLADFWAFPRPADERTAEVWADTVRRVVLGSLAFAPMEIRLPNEAIDLFDMIYNFKGIPGGRHLWVTGTSNAFSRNCFVAGWSPRTSDHFRFSASRLFEGGGVGANYSADLMSVTQSVISKVNARVTIREDHPDYEKVKASAGALFIERNAATNVAEIGDAVRTLVTVANDVEATDPMTADDLIPGGATYASFDTFTVVDQREGWVDLWVHLIDLACTPLTDGAAAHNIIVDASDLRPHGAVLKTFGGRASGPAPLANSIAEITGVLNNVLDLVPTGRRLTSLEAMTLDHYMAASIVAGGARRSARMSIVRWDDPNIFDFINSKMDQMLHWSTNISVEVDAAFHTALGDENHPQHAHAKAVLHAVATGMAANGEPGMVDTSVASVGEHNYVRVTNPCGEIFLETDPTDGAGESCNLGSVNLDAFGLDDEGATKAFELMGRFLYRATLNPYPDEAASRIEKRNRRIGVGLMGLHGWVLAHGLKLTELAGSEVLRDKLTAFRLATRKAADGIADDLGLPRSVKVTTVAPTGTISQMAGTTAGIHSVHAKYFIRRVRYVDSDPKLAELAAQGYDIVDDIYAANTKVVSFPVKDALLDRFEEGLVESASDISFLDFMSLVACIQDTFCGGTDGNAVSATATIPGPPMKTLLDEDGGVVLDYFGLPKQVVDYEALEASGAPAAHAAAMTSLLGKVKGITAFPEISRALSPLETITKADYDLQVALLGAQQSGSSLDGECVGGACPVR